MKPLEKYFPILQSTLQKYEKEHPHWQVDVLVSLIKRSFQSLRYYIEDKHSSAITWQNPIVELHHPIGWNWKKKGAGDLIAPGGHIFGKITARNTATRQLAQQTLARIMANQFDATVLANATNWAWYEKRKNRYIPALPIQLMAGLDSIEEKEKRRSRFDELMRPFSIGAIRVALDKSKLKPGTRVSKLIRSRPSVMGEPDIEGMRVRGEINGRSFDSWLVFEIHPLIADYDKKKAYHPIIVGLGFTTEMRDGKIVEESPAGWPNPLREQFWERLFGQIDKLKQMLIPTQQTQETVVLPVTSKIKIPAEWWHPESRSATIKLMADVQGQIGEILEFAVGQPDKIENISAGTPCKICGWAHDANFTQIKLNQHKVVSLGGVLPDIVAVVHRSHEKGFPALSTKDPELIRICGSYKHPCKAFDDLNHRDDYKILFARQRGFISLCRASEIGSERKSESDPE